MVKIYIKHNEIGRTLLEIMGVLGLMGLLSVGALQLWGTSVSKMHANNLLEEAKIRAVMGNKTQKVRGIYGSSDFKRGAELTTYGYGIAKNADEVFSTNNLGEAIEVKSVKVVMIPVGKINRDGKVTGRKITPGVCKALLSMVYSTSSHKINLPGDLMGIYEDKTHNDEITRCESEDEDSFELPDVVYFAIKK